VQDLEKDEQPYRFTAVYSSVIPGAKAEIERRDSEFERLLKDLSESLEEPKPSRVSRYR
jgi:hypothetical protein